MKHITEGEIYKKIKNISGLGGMTVNERLYATDLMEIFENAIQKDKKLAIVILEAIQVDKESIEKILN